MSAPPPPPSSYDYATWKSSPFFRNDWIFMSYGQARSPANCWFSKTRRFWGTSQYYCIEARINSTVYCPTTGATNMCKLCALITLSLLKKENLTLGRFSYDTVNIHKNYTQYFPTVYTNAIIWSSEDKDLTYTTVNTHMSKYIITFSKHSRHVKSPWFTVVIHTEFNTR